MVVNLTIADRCEVSKLVFSTILGVVGSCRFGTEVAGRYLFWQSLPESTGELPVLGPEVGSRELYCGSEEVKSLKVTDRVKPWYCGVPGQDAESTGELSMDSRN
jgi:hypothetical protein